MAYDRPALSSRVYLLVLCLIDIVGLVALLLQLTPEGLFPFDLDDVLSRLSDGALVEEFWFWPIVVSAAVFPGFCGAFLGAGLQQRWSLWVYTTYAAMSIAFRCYLCFEMSRHEGVSESSNRILLMDMLAATSLAMVQLAACESAARMAMVVDVAVTAQAVASRSSLPGGQGAARRRRTDASTTRARQRDLVADRHL